MPSTRVETWLGSPAVLAAAVEYHEAIRQRIVRLVFIVYWLLVFEGVLRKWVMPEQELLLFFIRDPFVLWIYWLALRHRVWPAASPFLTLGVLFAGTALVLAPLQLLIGDYDLRYLLLGGYGWRNYFLYLPLAFIIGDTFRPWDLQRLVRHTLLFSLPAALLAAAQYSSPPNAVVNLGSSLNAAHQFHTLGVAFGVIRPTGFFSSTAGQANFVVSLTALLLSAWLVPQAQRPVGTMLLWGATAATASMVAVSGSRGLMVQVSVILIGAAALVLIARSRDTVVQAGVLPALFALTGLILFPVVFPTAYDAFIQRWHDAYLVESRVFETGIWGRAFAGFYRFLVVIPQVPLFGHMIGMGANAARRLDWVEIPSIQQPDWLGGGVGIEDPWSSHILELGPIIGVPFILFRIGFTVWLGVRAVRATWHRGHPLPMLLFSWIGVMMLLGYFTGQGTSNGYAWLFTGFLLAACQPDEPGDRVPGVHIYQDRAPYRRNPC